VLDPAARRRVPHLARWFQTATAQPHFAQASICPWRLAAMSVAPQVRDGERCMAPNIEPLSYGTANIAAHATCQC